MNWKVGSKRCMLLMWMTANMWKLDLPQPRVAVAYPVNLSSLNWYNFHAPVSRTIMLQIQFFLHSTSFFLHGTTFALEVYVVVPWRRKVVLFILEKGDIEGCLPLKVIFHQRSSSNQGRLPSKVSFHQGHLPLKVVFHRCSSSIEDLSLTNRSDPFPFPFLNLPR